MNKYCNNYITHCKLKFILIVYFIMVLMGFTIWQNDMKKTAFILILFFVVVFLNRLEQCS